MRLIDVEVVLNLEEGNKVDPASDVLKDFSDDDLEDTKYAILSHCWYRDKDEVQFRDMDGLINDSISRQGLRERLGYQKILKSCELVHKDDLRWLWVDTCCINKESSAELTEAINSMFRWYDKAEKCYTYLHDVKANTFPTERNMDDFPDDLKGWPKWFSRGWTLQELVAPRTVVFFNHEWRAIGNKDELASTLEDITCIPSRVLKYGMDAYRPSIAQVMSWASDRKTKRVEDRAYSLLGLFGVHMPMLYGEGKNAFRRLQLELIRMTNDHSIFAWDRQSAGWTGSVLADDPSLFRDCDDIVKMEPGEYLTALKGVNPDGELYNIPEESLRTYSVTNAGIQISLPLKRCRGFQSVFEARLACRHSPDSSPIAVVFASFKSNYYRAFGDFEPVPETTAQFQPLYLVYREEKRRNDFTFKIDDRAIFYDGFVRRCVFPEGIILEDSSVKLSNTSDRAIIVYANDNTKTCFAVVVGYFLGHEWVHVVCDDPPEESKLAACKAYAEQVYKRMRMASPEHAQRMAQAWQTILFKEHPSRVSHLVEHAHLHRFLRGVRIVYKQLLQPQTCSVTIDVVRCTGCCVAPGVWQALDGFSSNGPDTPGLMMDGEITQDHRGAVHRLLMDGVDTRFMSALGGPEINLGDYGHWDGVSFTPRGNIFADLKMLGVEFHIDPKDHNLSPVSHEIRSRDNISEVINPVVKSVEFNNHRRHWEGLFLYHPKGFSLPTHNHVVSLLDALANHLEDKYLITTVVQCSDCHFSNANKFNTMRKTRPKHNHGNNGFWKKLHISTPLYILMKPLVWQSERAHENTRIYFEQIRKHFHVLLDAQHLIPQTATHGGKSLGEKEMEITRESAIHFFSNIFGGGHFKGYIGDITCFELIGIAGGTGRQGDEGGDKLPHIPISKSCHAADGVPLDPLEQQSSLSDSSAGTPHAVPDIYDENETVHDPRIEGLAATLMKRMSDKSIDMNSQRTKMVHEAEELRAKSFGMEVLQTISAVYQKSPEFIDSSTSGEERAPDMGRVSDDRCKIRLLVQDVKALEAKLTATHVDDERRTLEEDITGRILLACWQGIRSEIEQIVEKVIRRIVNDKRVKQAEREDRSRYVQQDGKVLEMAIVDAPDYDHSHLRRILADAGAGISKYELLMAASRGELHSTYTVTGQPRTAWH